ncbi:MAG: HAMP domain-containing sensor histidine kinase [Pseudomonadota bacterium]
MPGLISLASRLGQGTLKRLAQQYEAAIWVVSLCATASITGGVFSPLCGLLLVLPVVALIEGDRQAAVDAAIVALIGFTCLALSDVFLILPALAEAAWPLLVFPLVAALLWVAFAALLVALPPRKVRSAIADKSQIAPRIWRSLDNDGPVCAIDLSPLGRVRSLSGNTDLLPTLKTGQLFERLVAAPGRQAFADRLQKHGEVRLALPEDRALRLFIRPGRSGTTVYAMSADSEQRAVMAAERAAEEAVKARNLFFASLSHDLKTPLNAILGFADMMRAGLKGPLSESYKDYADIIHESGEDLMLLVEDILDLAKSEADRQALDIEPIDLASSGRSVMRQMQGQAQRAGITLSLEFEANKPGQRSGAWAMADARAVRQIWQNLVSNAVKYARRGGTVDLRTAMAGDHVILEVEDRGEGMDAADLGAIAEPFAQGQNAVSRPGTGLGLTVVKRFADLMGGRVDIQSVKGQGTIVRVSLPAVDSAALSDLSDAAE